jgi:hypothetical protein
LDIFNDVADVIVGDVGTGREAEAYGKEGFADTVHIGGIVGVNGLFVHRFPKRTGFDVGFVKCKAHCFDVGVGFAIGVK